MTEKLKGWNPEQAGKDAADKDRHKPNGTAVTRPLGWLPGSRYAPGYLRPPNGGQLAQSQRATKKSHANVALSRKLDEVLGTGEDE